MNEIAEKYCWIELAAMLPGQKMVRGQYVQVYDTDRINSWKQKHHNIDIFASVSRYEEPDNNSHSITPLFFDVDAVDDLAGAQKNTIMLCELLMDRISLDCDSLGIYFSGHKGFHVILPTEVFCPRYSEHFLSLHKILAQRAKVVGLNYLDIGVYTRKRILRLPNSQHSKSQLYKIPLTYEELRDTDIAGILNQAKKPQAEDSYAQLKQNAKAVDWFEKAIQVVEKKSTPLKPLQKPDSSFHCGWRKPPCIKAIEKARLPEGLRHSLYYQLSRYYAWIGMHPEGIIEQLEEIDARHPIEDPAYIARTVMSGCQRPGFSGCQNECFIRFCNAKKCFLEKLHRNSDKNTRNQ